jgi:type I restriction enzyme S subunit
MSFSEWKEVLLEDIADLTVGFVGSMADEYVKEGVPFLRSLNIEPFKIKYDGIKYISQTFHDKLQKSKLSPGDVVIVRTGKPGACTVIPNSLVDANCSDLVIIRPHKQKIDSYFLAAYVNSVASGHVDAHLVGAVQQHFNVASAKKIKMLLPPLSEQKEISATLSYLDDKIELNNNINKTLEEMAQAIFKSWFVDFEPFQDGDFEDSELGKIPKGWRVVEIGKVVENIKDKVKEQVFPVLSAVKTGNLTLSEEYFTKQVFSKNISKYVIVKPYEFAYNPARINIGSIGMNEFNFDGCVSPVYVAFRTDPKYKWFIKLFIKTDKFNLEVNTRASGSVRQTLNFDEFSRIKIVYPPSNVIDKFNFIFESIYKTQNEIAKELSTLTNIRDTLLPKLMSGEIRVPTEEVQ